MVGLDAAGKTTILYKLKLGELLLFPTTIFLCCLKRIFFLFSTLLFILIYFVCIENCSSHIINTQKLSLAGEIVTTIPTIGFNVETVEYKNISFTVWGKFSTLSILCLYAIYIC